jgi:hypothetical protein
MTDIFSPEGIARFFSHLASDHVTWRLKDWGGQAGVILRQDVDLDLGFAERFMEIQRKAGVYSTFFVLLTQPSYNPQTKASVQILRRMVENGFEVGLHFDPTVDDDPSRLHREAKLLGSLCGETVVSVSLHNPTSRGEFPLYDGFHNAYDPKIFSPETYLSDSLFQWGKDPWTFVERSRESTLQLLFHPLHYVGGDYAEAFELYLRRYLSELDACFRPFNKTYHRQLPRPLQVSRFNPDSEQG